MYSAWYAALFKERPSNAAVIGSIFTPIEDNP